MRNSSVSCGFILALAGPALTAFALAGLFVSAYGFDTAEAAERVGVAAAVTPQATSQPPGESVRTLKIGKSVVYDERIETSTSGVVQVLLLDGSTFTVGPGSNLVIDKFVYDPKSGKGSLVASFSKGALRFVGGKLSKGEPGISVKTPAGVPTVRGGMFQGWIAGPNKALIAFLYGKHLSIARGGHLYTLNETGTLFDISHPGAPTIRTATFADTNFLLAAVSGRKIKYAAKVIPVKGQRWPYYYGIQPAGRYPDQPFVRELYYDTVGGDLAKATLKQVPIPVVTPPVTTVITPQVVQPQTTPTSTPVIVPIIPTTGPGIR
jgi:FecR protein